MNVKIIPNAEGLTVRLNGRHIEARDTIEIIEGTLFVDGIRNTTYLGDIQVIVEKGRRVDFPDETL